MPNYEKKKVVNFDKVTTGDLSCPNCGKLLDDANYDVVTVSNEHSEHSRTRKNKLEDLYIQCVCSCGALTVFVFKLQFKHNTATYVLNEVWLEVAGEDDV